MPWDRQHGGVSEEVTLDAFVSETSDGDREERGTSGDSQEGDSDPRGEGPADQDEEGPVLPTSVYDPDGVRCAGCSDSVERLFRTDEELRCRDCIAWQSSAEADGT
jgi:hypothetical protein